MALTILEGSTFCICNERGDIDDPTQGLFADDTRFLSLLRLTVNGGDAAAALVREGRVLLRRVLPAQPDCGRPAAGLGLDHARPVRRRRHAGPDRRAEPGRWSRSRSSWRWSWARDFADILSVKEHDFSLGDPERAQPLPELGAGELRRRSDNQFVLRDRDGDGAATRR